MKSYKEVVNERYDCLEKDIHPYNNIYSILNPIGFYGDNKIRTVFHKCFNFIRRKQIDLTQVKVLDIGCGKGSTTRFFSELTDRPENVFGMDLSENRISCATKMNSNINYVVGDLLFPPSFPITFEIITAVDIFMHLSSREEIILGLNNIKKLLNDDGYFIWYDAFAIDHFKTTEEQDHSGFHPNQMIDLAKEVGFNAVFRLNVFKKIFWKYHSLYLVKRLPKNVINLLEKILPGNPGNVVFIFTKSN